MYDGKEKILNFIGGESERVREIRVLDNIFMGVICWLISSIIVRFLNTQLSTYLWKMNIQSLAEKMDMR